MLREIITPYVIWGVILFASSVAQKLPNITISRALQGVRSRTGGISAELPNIFSVTHYDNKQVSDGSGYGCLNHISVNFNNYNNLYEGDLVTPPSRKCRFFIKY